jgi:hypothetical protein
LLTVAVVLSCVAFGPASVSAQDPPCVNFDARATAVVLVRIGEPADCGLEDCGPEESLPWVEILPLSCAAEEGYADEEDFPTTKTEDSGSDDDTEDSNNEIVPVYFDGPIACAGAPGGVGVYVIVLSGSDR